MLVMHVRVAHGGLFMSIKSKPFYWLECDEPECGNKSTDGDEYDAWADESQAIECAYNADWLILEGEHYCDGHASKHDPDAAEEEEVA